MFALEMRICTDGDFTWERGTYCPPSDYSYGGDSYILYFENREDATYALLEHIATVHLTFNSHKDYMNYIKEVYYELYKYVDKNGFSKEFYVYEDMGNQHFQYEIYEVKRKDIGNGFIYTRIK